MVRPNTQANSSPAICFASLLGNVPSATLLRQAGAKISYQHPDGKWILQDMPTGLFAAGAVNGVRGWDHSVASGRFTGWAAAGDAGFVADERPAEPPATETAVPAVPIAPHPKGRDFIDLDEDIQVKDIAHTLAEGFDEMELIKRYSSLGMGPAQGRQSAFAAMMLVSRLTGRPPSSVGLTTARPPILPVKLANLGGRIYLPERRTSIHHRHLEAGGEMMVTGPWLRPAYYRRPGGRREAVGEEVMNVHENVGVIDVSTLGKFEVRGPDAAEFLNRIYTMNHARQRIGRARYALMLNEAGAVVDDGVVARASRQSLLCHCVLGKRRGRLPQPHLAQRPVEPGYKDFRRYRRVRCSQLSWPKIPRDTRKTHDRYRCLEGGIPVFGNSYRDRGGIGGSGLADRVCWGARLRDPCSGSFRRGIVGCGDGLRRGNRDPPLRARRTTSSSPRKGTRHRQSGYGQPYEPS